MSKRTLILTVLAVICLVAGLYWGVFGNRNSNTGGNVVVRFNGGDLTLEDLAAHYNRLRRDPRYRKKPEQVTPEFAFEHAVNMEMIIAEGLRKNLHMDPRIRAEIHDFMADLFLKVMQENLVPKIDKKDFSEEELRAYFKAHPESYRTPALFDVYIIKNSDKAELERISAGISNSDFTFEEAARNYSSDPRTKEKGGAVGKRSIDSFRPEWQKVIAGLETGAISPPTAIGDDWYLFKMGRKTEPKPYRFEDREAYIRNDLLYARYREAWQKTYDRLKKDFSLEVDEALLEKFYKGEKQS